jgi:hypothetical protein
VVVDPLVVDPLVVDPLVVVGPPVVLDPLEPEDVCMVPVLVGPVVMPVLAPLPQANARTKPNGHPRLMKLVSMVLAAPRLGNEQARRRRFHA